MTTQSSTAKDTLVLNLSEDAWQGNAEFIVTVDGKQVGGTQTVTALRSAGKSQTLTLTGNWGSGAHTVGVTFINDAYGGTASTDRNLYVNSVSYDGTVVSNTTASLHQDGTQTYSIAAAASTSGTKLTSASGSLVDSGGNVWTLVQSSKGQGLQIACNGTVDTLTANVTLLEILNGAIVQENTGGNWYSESGPNGPWTQISAPSQSSGSASASPSGTTITSASGSLVDSSGNVWTLVQSSNGEGLQIACNGTIDTLTANVTLLESLNGAIVQENTSGNWYSEPGPNGPWTQISTPAGTSAGTITVSEPSTESVTAGKAGAVSGVKLADSGIAASSTITLTISDSSGTISMKNAAGATLSGSGGKTITVTDTLANLNTDLATLTYTAGSNAGSDTLSFKASSGSVSASGSTAITIGAASTTSTSTSTSTGAFHVADGDIIDPSGNVWTAKGINVYDSAMGDAAQILTDFPGLNFVRLNCFSYQDASAYASFINTMTSHGVVVEIEDHTAISGAPLTGSQLTTESNWYASLASAYKSNPYVWFGTYNEPGTQSGGNAVSSQEVATYNAVRNAGDTSPVLMELIGGGNPGTLGTGLGSSGLTASDYSSMTNIVWDLHQYDWVSGYSTSTSAITSALNTSISQVQEITSADGKVPVLIGEYGISTDGNTADAGGNQLLTAVQQDANTAGSAAWNWYSYAGSDNLTASGGSSALTSYGKEVATWIAAAH